MSDIDVHRGLIALRSRHGADSAIGHRCSNIIEQLDSHRKTKDINARRNLQKAIDLSVAELSSLTEGD